MGNRERLKKLIAATLMILAIAMVLFFTLQNPERSRDLSESVRVWLDSIGIRVGYYALRHNIHILEYFVVGLIIFGFSKTMKWKLWIGTIVSVLIATIDECIKHFIPGREFDVSDLIRDWIGIAIACIVAGVILVVKDRRGTSV